MDCGGVLRTSLFVAVWQGRRSTCVHTQADFCMPDPCISTPFHVPGDEKWSGLRASKCFLLQGR